MPPGITGGVTLPEISIPLLSDIPVIGDELFVGKPIFFTMFVLFVLTGSCCAARRGGCACARSARTRTPRRRWASTSSRVRYKAVVIGGLIAGLAGAWFSLETAGRFEDGMTGGTGFIALAA